MNYIKELTSLRAFAILLVILFHSPVPFFHFQFGWAGVNLFFILSGFLITRILISAKELRDQHYFRNFYMRRVLRIFPSYYFYILLAGVGLYLISRSSLASQNGLAEGWSDFANHWPFLFSYTYNFEEVINYFRHLDYNNSYFFGHLWSLSVEEQFYLALPIIIYFTPTKLLKRILVFTIVVIPILRMLATVVLEKKVQDLFWVGDVLYISTIFQLDTLGIGACLALFDFTWFDRVAKPVTMGLISLMVLVGLTHLYFASRYGSHLDWSTLGYDIPVYHTTTFSPSYWFNNRYFYSIPLLNFTFAAGVLWAIRAKNPPRIFQNRILMRIGKISYGIYIYHLSISFFVAFLFESALGTSMAELNFLYQLFILIVYLFLLVLFAEISYRFYETPFLKLKERFSVGSGG